MADEEFGFGADAPVEDVWSDDDEEEELNGDDRAKDDDQMAVGITGFDGCLRRPRSEVKFADAPSAPSAPPAPPAPPAQPAPALASASSALSRLKTRPSFILSGIPGRLSKEGWLTKQGGGSGMFSRQNWKRRWFVLQDNMVSYFDSKQKMESHVTLGHINLNTNSTIIQTSDCGLAIVTGARTYCVVADTPTECADWMVAFMDACNRVEVQDAVDGRYVKPARMPPPSKPTA